MHHLLYLIYSYIPEELEYHEIPIWNKIPSIHHNHDYSAFIHFPAKATHRLTVKGPQLEQQAERGWGWGEILRSKYLDN